jgi:dolichol-phosphate mannosyltransferase
MDEKNISEMSRNPDISIIIPCLNEEQNIPQLVNKLDSLIRGHALAAEVLIIDDCSDDYTFRESFVMQKDFSFLRALHKGLPRGIGHAVRYGIDHARGKMAVVVMGDLVDPIAAIVDFENKIIREGYKLALLSRYLAPEDHKNIPLSYKFYQWWYRFLCRILVGIKIRDITYAFRAFDLDWVRQLKLESGGFEISPEITLKTFLKGGRICEIKGRRIQGESKFLFSKEGSGYARVLLKAAILGARY